MPSTIETRKVPSVAFDFLCPFELAEGDNPDDAKRGKVRMLARSGQPIDHWYWGPIVHDFAGMRHKPKIALDWLHDQQEPVGYADTFAADAGDLVVEGELVSVQENDQAAKILAQGRAGIPFEASIKFGDQRLRIETIEAGMIANVNGRELSGPLTVFREWDLRGIAVCLYGYDPNTQTALSKNAAESVEVAITKLSLGEVSMPQEQQDDVIDQLAADQTNHEQNTPDPKAELRAKITDYIDRFGRENGTEWALADRPLMDCYKDHVKELRAEHARQVDALNAQIASTVASRDELQSTLDQLALGETTPASTNPAESEFSELSDTEKRTLTSGAAKYVNAMRKRAKIAVAGLLLLALLVCGSNANAQALMPRFNRLDDTPASAETDVLGLVRGAKPYQISVADFFGARQQQTATNVGAVAGTGVAVTEYGDGTIHQTVFTCTDAAVALTDEAGVIAFGGLKIYDAPEGMILILAAVADVDLTKSSAGVNDDWDGDFGIGTVTASNNADLTSTEQDILPKTATPQAAAGATTSNGKNAAVAFLDGTTTAKDVYVNFIVDDADHDVTSTACNLIMNGTITLTWIKAGDY